LEWALNEIYISGFGSPWVFLSACLVSCYRSQKKDYHSSELAQIVTRIKEKARTERAHPGFLFARP